MDKYYFFYLVILS